MARAAPAAAQTSAEPGATGVARPPAAADSDGPREGDASADGLVEIQEEHDDFSPHPQLEERVSVSSRLTERVQLSPANVTVITADQIARAGYRNVGEALAAVPGLYVSHDQVNYHVAVRGVFGGARAGSRSLKIMINGNAVSFVTAGTYFLGDEMIPLAAVERIEVLKGPASVIYGAGALVGAINIVTKRDPYVAGETSVNVQVQARGVAGGIEGGGGCRCGDRRVAFAVRAARRFGRIRGSVWAEPPSFIASAAERRQ
jgi:outer membrane receptor protein involved in Fe transport